MATTQSTRATAPTAASRAKANENDVDPAAQGKRKHDTLAQVPKNTNKPKEVKAKLDGVVIKSKPPPSTGSHQPLSTIAATQRASRATAQVRPLAGVKGDPAPALADPNGDEWDDLDTEDANDPLMISEYATEIFDYMKHVEVGASHVHCPLI